MKSRYLLTKLIAIGTMLSGLVLRRYSIDG